MTEQQVTDTSPLLGFLELSQDRYINISAFVRILKHLGQVMESQWRCLFCSTYTKIGIPIEDKLEKIHI